MYQFTSESVSEGHPDKVADLISDHIATWLITHNINNRAAIDSEYRRYDTVNSM